MGLSSVEPPLVPHAQLTETATQEPTSSKCTAALVGGAATGAACSANGDCNSEPVPAANAPLLSSVEPPLVPHAQLTETATQEPVPAANAPPLLLKEPPLV